MNTITSKGSIDNGALYNELLAALGAPGAPQRWLFQGSAGEVTVFFDGTVTAQSVQTVLDAHLAAAPARGQKATEDAFAAAVQAYMNAKAQTRSWDDIRSAALRAGYPGPFHDEGVAWATWMDACWAHCYQAMADVLAGVRTMPTTDQLIAEFPAVPKFA